MSAANNASSSQDLPKDAYASAFVSLKPRDGSQLLQSRLHKAHVLADELADYFAARRELESAYLKALQKISKRSFLSDPTTLGPGFSPVYDRLIAELGEVASIHGDLEMKLGQECETAMRTASTRGEWARQREHDDTISATVKEIQSLEQQLSKDQKKLESASSKKAGPAQAKVQETQRSLDLTLDLWRVEAPFTFEAYQRIDAQRLEMMKEAVTRFETAQSDAAQRLMSMTEKTLQTVLSFDPMAEMQDFILKNGVSSGSARPTETPRRRPTVATTMLQRSGSIASSTRSPARGNGQEFGTGASSASIHSNDQGTARGSSTLKSAFSRLGGRNRSNRADTGAQFSSSNDSPLSRPTTNQDFPSSSPMASGRSGMRPSYENSAAAPSGRGFMESEQAPDVTSRSAGGGGLMQPMIPTNRLASSDAPQVDSEGYSIPPPDRKPWETGPTSAVGGAASLMDDEGDEGADSVPSTTQKMSNMNIATQPVRPAESSRDREALERVRSTLLTAGPPTRRGTTRRDRRDVRNTTYKPNIGSDAASQGVSQFGGIAPQATGGSVNSASYAAPIVPTFTGTSDFGREAGPGAPSMSSRTPSLNPFEASAGAPGLRASITETVNAIIASSSGAGIARLMITGEVSVALKDVQLSQSSVHLRLEAFEQLEKVAPNPAFLSPIASSPGEYQLDVAGLARQQQSALGAGSSGAAMILKYQLHVSADKLAAYVPLNVDAKWRMEPHQTSFLLTYSPNPACRVTSGQLEDLSFVATLGPTEVTGLTARPEGVWNAEAKRIHWTIDEGLALSSVSSTPAKILARFQVDGEGQPRPVQVRWRLPGQTISSLGLAILPGATGADGAGVTFDEVVRQSVSGKFIIQ
ncbi:hypothetical protein BCV69DRAFT_282457 [Microstroma glucosiphilum]|uniref:MHD domain-containing protein n=1 Tax=Pseudomicrostroma glucosiphilum TaxID=1684307 RepID=A0A316U7X8_9BASI|nr:hypothetical protein BCV69DRAFT_282457 [Pseudomicrostroma glucosiphilum]PWN20948.1 hypothetical protein BCV69DRAFT_282457 [Pseudomicrostroma glucosiphilum]